MLCRPEGKVSHDKLYTWVYLKFNYATRIEKAYDRVNYNTHERNKSMVCYEVTISIWNLDDNIKKHTKIENIFAVIRRPKIGPNKSQVWMVKTSRCGLILLYPQIEHGFNLSTNSRCDWKSIILHLKLPVTKGYTFLHNIAIPRSTWYTHNIIFSTEPSQSSCNSDLLLW